MTPEITRENFRAFALGKFIRLVIARHATELGGYIFARFLLEDVTSSNRQVTEKTALIAHIRKIREEFQEVGEASPLTPKGPDNLAEEMADCVAAIGTFRCQSRFNLLSGQRAKITHKLERNRQKKVRTLTNPVKIDMLNHLERLLNEWPSMPTELAVCQLHYLAREVEGFINHLLNPVGGAVSQAQFLDACMEKDKSKGFMTGLYADIIVLPRAQTKWCAHLAERFPEINPELLDYSKAYNA